MAIVSYTWEELEKMPSYTDWERLKNMTDDDIDYSDNPAWTDEDFALATRGGKPLWATAPKNNDEVKPIVISLNLAPNAYFAYKRTGRNWKSRLKTNVENYLNQQVTV